MSDSVASIFVRELLPLGTGGMGTTKLGCSRGAGGFERLVVIKRLHEHLLDDASATGRLLEEAEIAGFVHHSNVVPVLHADKDARGVYLVLEYIEGASLKELHRKRKGEPLEQAIALRIMLDCLSGLEAIHETRDHLDRHLNILHRDLSPENILLGLDGVARLTDFGIAKSNSSQVKTSPKHLIGKAPYMAPEYISGGELGPAMDIYALGIVMWMLLKGESPWTGLENAQLLVRAITEGVPELSEYDCGCRLRRVVARACALRVKDRYSSAKEMKDALQAIIEHHPIASHSEVAAKVQQLTEDAVRARRREAAILIQESHSERGRLDSQSYFNEDELDEKAASNIDANVTDQHSNAYGNLATQTQSYESELQAQLLSTSRRSIDPTLSRREPNSGAAWEAVALPPLPSRTHRKRLTAPLLGFAAAITGAIAAGLIMLALPRHVISTAEISNEAAGPALPSQSAQPLRADTPAEALAPVPAPEPPLESNVARLEAAPPPDQHLTHSTKPSTLPLSPSKKNSPKKPKSSNANLPTATQTPETKTSSSPNPAAAASEIVKRNPYRTLQ